MSRYIVFLLFLAVIIAGGLRWLYVIGKYAGRKEREALAEFDRKVNPPPKPKTKKKRAKKKR